MMLAAGCTPGSLIRWGSGWSVTAVGKTSEGRDVVYMASKKGEVVALDAANGRQEWRVQPGGDIGGFGGAFGQPALGDKLIYIGDSGNSDGEEAKLHVFNRETGEPEGGPTKELGAVVGGPALGDGLVIAGSDDGNLYAFGEESFELAWFFKAGGPVWSAPAVADGLVYFGSMDRHVYAVYSTGDRAGKEAWRYKTGGSVIGKPLLLDGMVISGSFDKKLYALDAKTGQKLWTFDGDDWFWAGAASDGETIYASTMGGKVYALDKGGVEAWIEPFEAASPIVSVPVVIDDKLVVGTDEGKLFLLDAGDGGVIHSKVMDNRVKAPITFKARDPEEDFVMLFVGLEDGTVRGLKLDKVLVPVWRYPPEK